MLINALLSFLSFSSLCSLFTWVYLCRLICPHVTPLHPSGYRCLRCFGSVSSSTGRFSHSFSLRFFLPLSTCEWCAWALFLMFSCMSSFQASTCRRSWKDTWIAQCPHRSIIWFHLLCFFSVYITFHDCPSWERENFWQYTEQFFGNFYMNLSGDPADRW